MRTCKAGGPEAKVMICSIPLQLVLPNDLSALLCFHLSVWFVLPFLLASPFSLCSFLSSVSPSPLCAGACQAHRTDRDAFLCTQVAHPEMLFFFPSFGDECTSASSSDASSLSELTDNPRQCVDAHTREGACVYWEGRYLYLLLWESVIWKVCDGEMSAAAPPRSSLNPLSCVVRSCHISSIVSSNKKKPS